jgi:3'-phosphoadenosine 5'-phosphosulfate sulfotransferase
MTRDEEIAIVKAIAQRVWPGQTIEVQAYGGLRQPAESLEVWKVTTFGRTLLFGIRVNDAVKATERALSALLDGEEVPCTRHS